jgi:predicted O-linked N-acetylglucosamine transferase (SPINDLY family)
MTGLLGQAIRLHQAGRFGEAEQLYDRVLSVDKNNFEALHLLGTMEAQRGNLFKAHKLLSSALELKPRSAELLINLGNVLKLQGRFEEALRMYNRALSIDPNSILALNNRGSTLSTLRRFSEARASFDTALKIKPDYADALYNRGNLFINLDLPADALVDLDKAQAVQPDDPQILVSRGNALAKLLRLEEAIQSFNRALAIQPGFAEALVSRGGALTKQNRLNEALTSYDQALMARPNYAEALSNRGLVLHELKRFDEALTSYERALAVRPDFAEALANRGRTLSHLKRFGDALAAHDRALMLKPDLAEACCGRGGVLIEINQYTQALAAYDRAISLKPELAEAWFGRGQALMALAQRAEAHAAYEQAIKLMPELDYLLGAWLHARMHCCLWHDIQSAYKKVLTEVLNGRKAALPFTLLSIPSTLSEQKIAAETYVADISPPILDEHPSSHVSHHSKIRIGYFSADFRDHPVAYLIAQLFELHDRSKFEIFGFSLGPSTDDDMRRRLTAGLDQLIDVKDKSDAEITELARNLEIDIGVDLMGFTQLARIGIFARRAAPIQVAYLGFAGTMGAKYIDYIIADRTVILPEESEFYSEKIVCLPHSFQVNDRTRRISDRRFTRDELGLPADGFVFCCFNNCFKITPNVFDIWIRLLTKVDGSVLWLPKGNASAVKSLRAEGARRGTGSERLVFAERMDDVSDHLARLALADLFLDTFNYNAHATASDALWAGLPIVTRLGDTFAGRVAASLLSAVGLPELITRTSDEYEQLALELATDRHKLFHIKKRLADNRLKYPLFDTELFTKHIESAYQKMWERHLMNLKPDHLYVEPS